MHEGRERERETVTVWFIHFCRPLRSPRLAPQHSLVDLAVGKMVLMLMGQGKHRFIGAHFSASNRLHGIWKGALRLLPRRHWLVQLLLEERRRASRLLQEEAESDECPPTVIDVSSSE